MEWIVEFVQSFWGLCVEMAPYLLLGFLVAGILHVGVSQSYIRRHLSSNSLSSVLKAALFGIPLPLCSCGVIPTGISLYQNGASKSASVSFLISTPQTGVDSIFLTWSMLGLPFAIIRPVVALVTGLAGGAFTRYINRDERVTIPVAEYQKPKGEKGNTAVKALRYGFLELPADIAKWLIIGLVLAALVDVLVPEDFFVLVTANPLLELLFVLFLAVPLYVCATGSVPIAAVLILKGISPGAALVFLMAGPATNIATMTVIGKALGKKTLVAYLGSIIAGAVVFGFLINALPSEWFAPLKGIEGGAHAHHHSGVLEQLSAVLLLLLLVVSYALSKLNLKQKTQMTKDYTLHVEGMNCQHCQNSVKTNVEQMDGVDKVDVDLKTGFVTIQGEGVKMDEVFEKVRSLGFTPSEPKT